MEHVTRVGERRGAYRVLLERSEGSILLGVDGKIILKWILNKCVIRTWAGLIWLWIGIKCGAFFPFKRVIKLGFP
jgi:hypothetical protein